MIDPENTAWLSELVRDSELLPDRTLRAHWQRLIPVLSTAHRYELAAVLLEARTTLARESEQ